MFVTPVHRKIKLRRCASRCPKPSANEILYQLAMSIRRKHRAAARAVSKPIIRRVAPIRACQRATPPAHLVPASAAQHGQPLPRAFTRRK
jgi:hypothetical protein